MRLFSLFCGFVFLVCCSIGCDNSASRAATEYNAGTNAIHNPEVPNLELAYEHFNKAIAIDGTYVPAYLGRAYVLKEKGQIDAALGEYTKATKLEPTAGNTFLMRGKLNLSAGNYKEADSDFREAITLYTKAIDEDLRTAAEFDSKRRDASLQLAIGFFEQRQFDKALKEIENIFVLIEDSSNKFPEVYYWRARTYYEKCHPGPGEKSVSHVKLLEYYNKAISDFGETIWQGNKNADVYCRRAWTQFETGSYAASEADSLKALDYDADYVDAYYNLARIYAAANDPELRDGKKAVENAAEACRLTSNKSWYCLSAAAAAFAEAGDFNRAQRAQQMAIKLAPKQEQKEMQQRLALFRKKQPFRHRSPEATVRKKVTGVLTSAR